MPARNLGALGAQSKASIAHDLASWRKQRESGSLYGSTTTGEELAGGESRNPQGGKGTVASQEDRNLH